MFNTLGSFSAVYFALAAVLFILVLFEKHFIHLEEKLKAKKARSRKTNTQAVSRKPVQKCSTKAVSRQSRTATVRRMPNNAA